MNSAGPWRRRIVAWLLLLVASLGTSCDAPTAPAAAVRFEVDAPFCAGVQFRLRFSIDGTVIATDTLADGESSAAYATAPGRHYLRAEFLNAPTERDTTVTLRAGEQFAMVLDFYCS